MNCRKLKSWFEERYDIEPFRRFLKSKFVPEHKYDIWYYTGGIAMFLFVIQFVTGILLSFYYVPFHEVAHKSIIDIVTKLNMGWFFRSLHHWGAQLSILTLFVHAFSTLILKSYRKPRELVWITGTMLLGISIFFGLSGYLMLWDERAFAAVRVATGGVGNLPIIGNFIKFFLRGGIDVTGETLTRFYAFHVSLLPLITLVLVGIHLLLVQYHGISVPLSQENEIRGYKPFFPNVLYKDLMLWLMVFGIVVTVAALSPPEIGKKADPLAPPPENIKPEWYFLFLFQTLKFFPGEIMGLNGEMIAIILISFAILFFVLIPFFDKKSNRGERSTLFTWIGVLYTLYFIIMTIIGFLS